MGFFNTKLEVEASISKKFPFEFEKNIKTMLKAIPSDHLLHLGKIFITSISPEKKQKRAYGLYYRKMEGYELPTIVICADSIFMDIPKIIFYIMPFIPKLLLANTLYHEIAHHYQMISHGYKKEKWESSAELYSREMSKRLFLSSGIFRLFYSLRFIVRPILRKLRKNKRNAIPGNSNFVEK